MLAVAGMKHGAVVVTDVLAKEKVGSVGQYNVVFGEAFLHHGLRRSNDNETGTEPEREDFAVFLRQLSESAVERLLELQEVSYYRVRKWSWRKVSELSCWEEELKRKEKKHKYETEIQQSHIELLLLLLLFILISHTSQFIRLEKL